MLPRFSHLLRHPPPLHAMARAVTCASQPHFFYPAPTNATSRRVSLPSKSSLFGRSFHALARWRSEGTRPSVAVRARQKDYRKARRRAPKIKEKELELCVDIWLEEDLPDDPEILSIAELLRLNAPMAMKLAFDGLKGSGYKTRDTAISDVGGFDSVELSVLLCNDEFIRKLNKEWRDEDHATDVLSMSQHVPGLKLPILMLGDIVISVEIAARQAEERGHTLLDEIRILLVHGLLHLLGFDHEISEEAEVEMEREEEILLKSLDWKGKGLIKSACDAETNSNSNFHQDSSDDRKKEGSLRFYKSKFSYIFCDMDGTLLNSKSQISSPTVSALREASSRGVKIVIATGKARPAVIDIFKMVDLSGKDGIVSEFSPGVFLQELTLSRMIGSAKEADGLYIFEDWSTLSKQSQSICFNFVSWSKDNEIMLWHHRIGHPSFNYLQQLFPNFFRNKNPSLFTCETCQLAKHHRIVYPAQAYKPSNPFTIIHSDVCRLSRLTTPMDKRWFMSFIDDHTRST